MKWKQLFKSCGHCLSFPNLLAYWVQHFHSIISEDLKELNWNVRYRADLFNRNFISVFQKNFSDVGFSIFLSGEFLSFVFLLTGYIALTVNICSLDVRFQEFLKDYEMSHSGWRRALELLLVLPPGSHCHLHDSSYLLNTRHARCCASHL